MSIFDPQQLYYHRQKQTHKGQILQKKPVDERFSYSQSLIPRAINVLKNYHYLIYKQGQEPVHMSQPFSYNQANLTLSSLNYSVNAIWADFKRSLPALQEIIEEYPNPTQSHISIAISSAYFELNHPTQARFQFYVNGTSNINQTSENLTSNNYAYGVTFQPINPAQYVYTRDAGVGATDYSGNTQIQNRVADIDVQGVLNYVTLHNSWQQLNSQHGLQNDIKLIEFSRITGATTLLTGISISGFISVVLNDE